MNIKNAVKFAPALIIALPLIGYAFMGSTGGSYFANVASAGYGNDKINMCIPVNNRVAQYIKVSVPHVAAQALIAHKGAIHANSDGTCPGGTPRENVQKIINDRLNQVNQ